MVDIGRREIELIEFRKGSEDRGKSCEYALSGVAQNGLRTIKKEKSNQ